MDTKELLSTTMKELIKQTKISNKENVISLDKLDHQSLKLIAGIQKMPKPKIPIN